MSNLLRRNYIHGWNFCWSHSLHNRKEKKLCQSQPVSIYRSELLSNVANSQFGFQHSTWNCDLEQIIILSRLFWSISTVGIFVDLIHFITKKRNSCLFSKLTNPCVNTQKWAFLVIPQVSLAYSTAQGNRCSQWSSNYERVQCPYNASWMDKCRIRIFIGSCFSSIMTSLIRVLIAY